MILFEVIVPYACRSCQICLRASLCHTSHKKSQIYNIFRPLFTPTNSIVSYLMLNLENSRVIFCSIFRYTRFNFLTIISVTVAYASRKSNSEGKSSSSDSSNLAGERSNTYYYKPFGNQSGWVHSHGLKPWNIDESNFYLLCLSHLRAPFMNLTNLGSNYGIL